MKIKSKIKFADLFAGCGGLSYGFNKDRRFEHILAADIWEQAKITYQENFKNCSYELTDLSNESELESLVNKIGPDLDLLIGGPPCKGFSTMNNSKTESRYNTLVDQYLTVVEKTSPTVFLIENVRGFKSKKHPTGITYPEHVKNRISGFHSPYNIFEFILNANDYNVAQNRIRYFMLGTRVDMDPERKIIVKFKDELHSRMSNGSPVLKDVISDLPKVEVRGGSDKIMTKDGKIVYNHKSMNHSEKLEERFRHVPENGGLLDVPYELLTNHLQKVVNGEYGSGGFAKNIYGRMNWDKPSGTIVAGMDKITVGRFVHPVEHRLLTPRECARIQSFPDDFVFHGGMVSQYYQIGNAVPPAISQLFSNILGDIIKLGEETKLKELEWN